MATAPSTSTDDQETKGEKVKRLTPLKNTLRELFMVSGNRCAFPNCAESIIDKLGNFSAQICHIEAAEKGGERFNPNQTNEDRRHINNLILLCYPHHIETDKVNEYPVERLQQMKREHEAPFREGWDRVLAKVEDWTETTSVSHPTTLHSLSEWSNTLAEAAEYGVELELAGLRTLSEQVQLLSRPARELFRIILNRGTDTIRFGAQELRVDVSYLRDVTGLDRQVLYERLSQLEQGGVAVVVYDDEGVHPYVETRTATEFPRWSDIRNFCRDYDRDLTDVIVNLQFDLLD